MSRAKCDGVGIPMEPRPFESIDMTSITESGLQMIDDMVITVSCAAK
jgi:hypothetical protein